MARRKRVEKAEKLALIYQVPIMYQVLCHIQLSLNVVKELRQNDVL